MKRVLILFTLLIVVSHGCTERSIHNTLIDIESFIQERPDSALAILDTIDRTTLTTQKSRAHHALLNAMALDKNFVDVYDDSIARVAVDYYSKCGPRKNYARSLYYLGIAYYYKEDYNKAIVEFTKAEQIAEQYDSLYFGLSKLAQANSYGKTHNVIEEIKCIEKADTIFSSLNYEHYSLIVQYRLMQSYINNGKYDVVEKIYQDLINNDVADENLISAVMATYALMQVTREKYESAIEIYNEVYNEYGDYFLLTQDYWAWAYSLDKMGYVEQSKAILEQLKQDRSATSAYWQYMIAKSNTDMLSALAYLEEYVEYNDLEVSDALKQSLSSAQKEFYESQAENLKYKADIASMTMVIIILVTLIFIILVFISIRMYMKKQEDIKEKYLLYISEIKHQLDEAQKDDYPSLKKKYISLYKTKFETIGALYEQYVHSRGVLNAETSVYRKVSVLVNEFLQDYNDTEKFELMLDEDMDNIMTNLHNEMPDLKKNDYVIFSLFVIGFDATTISHLLNTSINMIYIRKSRIRHKILEVSPYHQNQFLDVLE